EARICHEFSIPPQAVLELGLVELELNNAPEAIKWLNKATNDYHNYPNENFVHLRAYAALRQIGVSTDKQSADQSLHNDYKNEWLKEIRKEGEEVESVIIKESELSNYYLSYKQSFCESLVLVNEFMAVLTKTDQMEREGPLAQFKPLYDSYLVAIRKLLIALGTKHKSDVDRAVKAVDKLLKLCQKQRKTGLMLTIMSYFSSSNYYRYADVEAHSELLYAYGLCISAFVVCRQLYRRKHTWVNHDSRQLYESGYRLASGLSHLFISHIPPKLLRIINLIGVAGVESVGFDQLNKAAFMTNNVNSQVAKMILIFYWSYLEPVMDIKPKHVDICGQVLDNSIDINAKLAQISGRIDESIDIYQKLLEEYEFDLMSKCFQFELIISNALRNQFTECIKYAQRVRKGTVHSPAFTTYIEAVCRYVKAVNEDNAQEMDIAVKLLGIVPSVRVRYFGKTLTVEKMAVVSAQKFTINADQSAVLPDMDILYQLNYLSFIAGNSLLLNKYMKRIVAELEKYAPDLKTSDYLDNYLTVLESSTDFSDNIAKQKIVRQLFLKSKEGRICREHSIPPQAVLELGLVELELNNAPEANKWLNKAINDYRNYMNENYVQIRAYAGLRKIGVSTDKHNADESTSVKYRNQWLSDIRCEDEDVEKLIELNESVQ
ncbi:unnamed protein product, partial [Medioppia subpectinata]